MNIIGSESTERLVWKLTSILHGSNVVRVWILFEKDIHISKLAERGGRELIGLFKSSDRLAVQMNSYIHCK